MNQIHVAKGEILQRPDALNTKIYLVKSGLLRSYIIDKKGKEHIFLFGPKDWHVADTCEADQPSTLYIDAIEDSVVEVSEKSVIDDLIPSRLLRNRVYVLQKRVLQLMSYTAIERYEHFMDTYPSISQRVPQRMIASYLGITPEALSKVKRLRLQDDIDSCAY